MCEIFPEVDNCCMIFSLRIGLLFISVWAVITGAVTLCVIEQTSDASFDNLKNVSDIRQPKQALTQISQLIPTGITGMSVLFMLMGLVLLFATLSEQEGFVQMFVWVIFFTVIFGFIMILAIGFECMFKDICTLSSMDWLSGSTLLVMMIAYLFEFLYSKYIYVLLFLGVEFLYSKYIYVLLFLGVEFRKTSWCTINRKEKPN